MTEAPSIKEALEPFASVPPHSNPDQRLLVIDAGNGPYHFLQSDLDRAKAALATFQPDGERRAAIAPLRNRLADLIHQNYEPPPEGFPETEPWNGGALDIVDMIIEEILASGLVQDEAAIRRDEREKCAEIADKHAASLDNEWNREIGKANDLREVAEDIAIAISSARDGGAS